MDVFAYAPANSTKTERKSKTDAKGDACLDFNPGEESFLVGTYAVRYRSVAPFASFQSLPQEVTIRMKHIGSIRAFGERALGH